MGILWEGSNELKQPMQTNDKAEYIRQWQSYVDVLYTLALCPKTEEQVDKQVAEHIKELKELVVKVADAKWADR